MSRAREVAVAFDCQINSILGGYAWETFSARTWRLRANQPFCFLRPVIDVIMWWDGPNHCQASYQAILDRLHLPKEYRDAESLSP